jgi:hypothetical protein
MSQELPLRVLLKYAALAFAVAMGCGGSADAQEWLLNGRRARRSHALSAVRNLQVPEC